MQSNFLSVVLMPLALSLIMMGLGLSLTLADFKRVYLFPKAVIIGLFAKCLSCPSSVF